MVTFPDPRSRHPYHMHDMIRGQPEFVRETLRRLERVSARDFLRTPRHLVLTGCGTSFHAAMYGARLLAAACTPRTTVHAVHAYDLLHGSGLPDGATVLGVSHSGNTPTTNAALGLALRMGARTLGLCGLSGTPMDSVADEVLTLGSLHDRSWANTMSYTSQLTTLAWLAVGLSRGVPGIRHADLEALPGLLRRTLRCGPAVRALARRVAARARVTFLGSGLDEITALEAALKIRETCSLPASGYHVEQFLHGPFLSLDSQETVVALRSRDDGTRERAILVGLKRTGANVAVLGDGRPVDIRVPATHRLLRPILSAVPLQLLAYYAALEKKANPDIMRSEVPRYQAGLARLFA